MESHIAAKDALTSTSKNKPRDLLVALAVISAVTVAFYHRALFFGEVLYGRDLLTYVIPVRSVIRDAYLSGRLPLWNPYLFCGVPLIGDITFAPLYPPSLLLLLFDTATALTLQVVAHHFWAALGMYLFLRRVGAGLPAALVAGLGFAFAGFPVSVDDNMLFLTSFTWTPWVLLALDRLIERLTATRVAVLGLALAFQFLAGDVQWVYVSLFLYLAYLLLMAPRGTRVRAVGGFAGAGVLALLLSGIQLLATMSVFSSSQRSGGLADFEAMRWSLHPLRLLELFLAGPFGTVTGDDYWGRGLVDHETLVPFIYTAYIGAPLLLLACFAWRKRRRLAVLCAVGVLLGLALALGDNFVAYGAARDALPLWSSFRYPQKTLALVVFAVSVLGGLGLEAIASDRWSSRAIKLGAYLTLAGAVVVAAVWGSIGAVDSAWVEWIARLRISDLLEIGDVVEAVTVLYGSLGALAIRLLVLGLLLLLLSREGRLRRLAVSTLVLVVAADLLVSVGPTVRTTGAELFTEQSQIAEALFDAAEGDPVFRIYRDDSLNAPSWDLTPSEFYEARRWWEHDTLLANVGISAGLHYARGYGVVPSVDAREMWRRLSRHGERALILTGVRFVIAPFESPVFSDSPAFRTIWSNEPVGVTVYEYLGAVPPARIVYRADVVETSEEGLERLLAPDFDPRMSVVLLARDAEPVAGSREWDSVEITRYEPTAVDVAVEAPEDGYLLLSDTFHSDWHAEVNGDEVPILRANYDHRAVYVTAGSHEVRFRFRPASVRWGAALSGLGILVFIALLWLGRRRAN